MAFSLDNPGFLLGSGEDHLEASAPDLSSQHSSTASQSKPSSRDSARRNYQKCHGRMSSYLLTDILFVTNVVVLTVTWRIGVMNVCLGPWRRWSLALSYVSR